MTNRSVRHAMLLLTQLCVLLVSSANGVEATVNCRPESKIANGTMVVCSKRPPTKTSKHLLIHFHGANKTTQTALQRSDLDAVLVIVNFPGLSTAYSKPFAEDAGLFQEILDRAKREVHPNATSSFDWERISLSSFSAGYGAVREILKTPKHFEHINDIVVADSIYAGLQQEEPVRRVDEKNMRDFLAFARLAVDSKKRFTISHSSQPTPYASTTETADYLLHSLNIDRRENDSIKIERQKQKSQASSGQFLVLGFDGVTGQAHMQHLHHIALFWNTIQQRADEQSKVKD